MSILVHFNSCTEVLTIDINEHRCIFDDVCNAICSRFDLKDLLTRHRLVYYDPSHRLWTNFNIHSSRRVTELLQYTITNTVEIRVKPRANAVDRIKNVHVTAKSDCMTIEENSKLFKRWTPLTSELEPNRDLPDELAHLTIWLDENIGNGRGYHELKRNCCAMINTCGNFLTHNGIDILIRHDSNNCNDDATSQSNSKFSLELSHHDLSSLQCITLFVDNMDEFLHIFTRVSRMARSIAIIVSPHFARDIMPIVFFRQVQEELFGIVSAYVLCTDIRHHLEWALHYIDVNINLLLFDDEQELIVRLINDIIRQLAHEGDKHRSCEGQQIKALQLYTGARQLFVNRLLWSVCPDLTELTRLNQLIDETAHEVTLNVPTNFPSKDVSCEENERTSQQCCEIIRFEDCG